MRTAVRFALPFLTALAALAPAALAGTAEPSMFEPILLEAQRKSAPGARVGPATCQATPIKPEGVTLIPCTVMVEGLKVPYHFVLTVKGEKANYNLEIERALLDTRRVLPLLWPKLKAADRAKLTISCGPGRYVLADVGQTLNCTLKVGARSSTVQVTVENIGGRVGVTGKLP